MLRRNNFYENRDCDAIFVTTMMGLARVKHPEAMLLIVGHYHPMTDNKTEQDNPPGYLKHKVVKGYRLITMAKKYGVPHSTSTRV